MEDFARKLAAAREGDRQALGEIVESLRTYLLWVANDGMACGLRRKVGASDVVQETLAAACRDLDSFRGNSRDELRHWIVAILNNQLANLRRHYQQTARRDIGREVALESVSLARCGVVEEHPAILAVERETELAVRSAIDGLPEPDRRLIGYREDDDLSFDEIGRRMGITSEAARKRFDRTKGRLRMLLVTIHGDD
jgi:RNA polymerase sigma-70 factor, ECF subfamily